jgi:hypothetical protein
MVSTCRLFYGRKLKFGGEFCLHYPIDKTEVPILYKLKLVNRCKEFFKKMFKFIQIPKKERRAC